MCRVCEDDVMERKRVHDVRDGFGGCVFGFEFGLIVLEGSNKGQCNEAKLDGCANLEMVLCDCE
jgi:hypothetical protein